MKPWIFRLRILCVLYNNVWIMERIILMALEQLISFNIFLRDKKPRVYIRFNIYFCWCISFEATWSLSLMNHVHQQSLSPMARSRSQFSNQETSPNSTKSREWDSMSRWSEYLPPEGSSPSTSNSWKHRAFDVQPSSAYSQKALHMEWVVQMSMVAEGLLTKMYRLNKQLDCPDLASHTFSESFWKAGILPNYPRICTLMSKKFPEHPSKLQLERVSVFSLWEFPASPYFYMFCHAGWQGCIRLSQWKCWSLFAESRTVGYGLCY